jgi:hypothetical protein
MVAAIRKKVEETLEVKSEREKEDLLKQFTPKTFDLIKGRKT